MASSREAELRLDRASASRTISDLVRRELAAVASSLANCGLESLTVIVGIQLSYYLLQQLQYREQGPGVESESQTCGAGRDPFLLRGMRRSKPGNVIVRL